MISDYLNKLERGGIRNRVGGLAYTVPEQRSDTAVSPSHFFLYILIEMNE